MAEHFQSKMRRRGVVVHVEPAKSRSSKSDEEPAEKRRRVEEEKESKKDKQVEEDEMWDELTQEDMANIDILESQAISHLPAEPSSKDEPQPSTSGTGSFIRPQQVAKRTSSSSSSSSGLLSGSSYPSQPSGASGASSSLEQSRTSSLSSHSSGEGPRLARGRAVGDTGSSGPHAGLARREADEILQMKNRLMELDGEIKILREAAAQKDKVIAQLTEEKNRWHEQKAVEKSERERTLQTETEQLKTRIEFMTREMEEYKQHLAKHQGSEQGTGSPEKTSPSGKKTAEVSPRPLRVTRAMKWKETWKGGESKEAASPRKVAPPPAAASTSSSVEAALALKEKADAKEVQPKVKVKMATKYTQCPVQSTESRNFQLSVHHPSGQLPGSHLVAQLLEQKRGAGGEVVDRGLVGLLHLSTPDMDLHLRHRPGSFPTTPARGQSFRSQDFSVRGSLAPAKNYLQAVEGLQKLLTEDQMFSVAHLFSCPPTSSPPGTVYLLPLLGDYLARYGNLLSSLAAKEAASGTPGNTGSKSSSSESTMESGASLEIMLREGTSHANLLETSALSALIILRKLAQVCPAVVRLTMGASLPLTPARSMEVKASSSSSLSAMETDQGMESGMEGDDEASSPSHASDSSVSLLTSVSEINILQQLCCIANPTEEPHKSNLQCVEASLDVLVTLTRCAPPELLDRLSGLATRGILTNCLNCGTLSTVSRAVRLMTALGSCSSAAFSLCTASGHCPVLLLYSLGVVDPKPGEETAAEVLYQEIFDFIWNVFSRNPEGFHLLLETECQCCMELVPCLVTVVYRKLHRLQMSGEALVAGLEEDTEGQPSLASQALQLLQAMAQIDPHFVERHLPVQPLYVFPLSLLVAALRQDPDFPNRFDDEFTALCEMWDIDQDDSELALESDQDANASMET